MKFSLSWLKEHLETDADAVTIADTLTRIGLEVEQLDDPAAKLGGFLVAAVTAADPHPNADRLRVCRVEIGDGEPVQVVCGAPNARAGMRSVFAPVGTYIPGKNTTLGAGVIRGVESRGMLCSAAELTVSDEHDGIMDLPADAPIGTPYAQWAGLADPVFAVNLTPNRPDAMGVFGVARDLAAAGSGRLKSEATPRPARRGPCPVRLDIALIEKDVVLAPAIALCSVAGVRNTTSPDWLQARLRAIGLRPINALVDITNFLTFDRARPLHVFDAAKVRGGLVIRRARVGERLLALDGKTYDLDEDMVVIADDSGPVSLAGIMGGQATGCDEATTEVLIESAVWQPANIAATGRKLGISSDARYRFERGVDPAGCLPGLDIATAMVLELCGGAASDLTLAGRIPAPDVRITFPESEVLRLTGLDLPSAEIEGILQALGFELTRLSNNADQMIVRVPSFRPDVGSKADLVEEVVRIAGLERVAPRPLPPARDGVAPPTLTPLQRRTRDAKRALAASGLVEAVTWSFVSKEQAAVFGQGQAALALANPIAADLSDMRPSLIPGLLAAVGRNAARGNGDLGLFEVGQVFRNEDDQRTAATVVRSGTGVGDPRHWSGFTKPADVFTVKADAMGLLAALGVPVGGLQMMSGGPDFLHPGRSMTLRFGPKNVIGHVGELHPRALAHFDVTGPVVAFEILLDALPSAKVKPTKTKGRADLPDLMPLMRDFAFIIDQNIEAAEIVKAAQGVDRTLIAGVSVFDIYVGQGVPAGKKSVALAARIQPRANTLTEVEIDTLAARIIAAVVTKTGAVLRG